MPFILNDEPDLGQPAVLCIVVQQCIHTSHADGRARVVEASPVHFHFELHYQFLYGRGCDDTVGYLFAVHC